MQTLYKHVLLIYLVSVLFYSCNKYLDEKALKQNFIPETIEDFQALLDNPGIYIADPSLLQILSDDYYVTTAFWQSVSPELSSNYIWAHDALPYNSSWNLVYQQPIYLSNIVLEYLENSNLPKDDNYNRIKGAALFHRAMSFFNLSQIYALPYSELNLNEPGIVLRSTTDISEKSIRATVKETYDKILTDLKVAFELLPSKTVIPTRPSKVAAIAALARIYLNMRDYENAYKYSDLAINMHDKLIDFNTLTPGQPISSFSEEVIYHSGASSASIIGISNAKIDTSLLNLYHQDDLRKQIFFRANSGQNKGTFAFRGSFNGSEASGGVFTGATTAEMLLIRSECNARMNKKNQAIADLNLLLEKRIDNSKWIPIKPEEVENPLELVLLERRKELVFRGLRWMDLRRYNMEGANITLKRVVNNTLYTLPPFDKRWLPLIPYDVINRSGISQNPR